MPKVSEKVASNAASLDGFLQMVKKDMNSGLVRALMMPVRDGMLALATAPPAYRPGSPSVVG